MKTLHVWYYKPNQVPAVGELTGLKGESTTMIFAKRLPSNHMSLHPQTWSSSAELCNGFGCNWLKYREQNVCEIFRYEWDLYIIHGGSRSIGKGDGKTKEAQAGRTGAKV